jgi:anti-anti-sigma factor
MSSVTVESDGSVFQIAIKGRFDFNLLQSFRDAYADQQGNNGQFVIDLAQTEYIDSSALGMLLNMKNHLGADDRQIEIRNCQPNLIKIFTIAHFDKKFQFV